METQLRSLLDQVIFSHTNFVGGALVDKRRLIACEINLLLQKIFCCLSDDLSDDRREEIGNAMDQYVDALQCSAVTGVFSGLADCIDVVIQSLPR